MVGAFATFNRAFVLMAAPRLLALGFELRVVVMFCTWGGIGETLVIIIYDFFKQLWCFEGRTLMLIVMRVFIRRRLLVGVAFLGGLSGKPPAFNHPLNALHAFPQVCELIQGRWVLSTAAILLELSRRKTIRRLRRYRGGVLLLHGCEFKGELGMGLGKVRLFTYVNHILLSLVYI